MTLLAPWFLLGLLAVGIPPLLHLRRSRQGQTLVFSTTQFFDEQFMRSARRARIQNLLLMLLRMALLAALALALTQPLIRSAGVGRWLGLDGPRTVAIVIDDSASMGAASASGTLLARAKTMATQLVDDLSSARGDRATVVLAGLRDAGPTVLFETPSDDLAAVRRAIEQVQLTDLGTDLDAAVTTAARVIGAKTSATGRRVYVLSDVQTTSLASVAALEVPPTVGVVLAAIRPGDDVTANNLSIDAVQQGASRPMVGVPFTFRALINHQGRSGGEVTAKLVINNQVISQRKINLEPGRATIIRFTHRFASPGWFAGHVEIAPAPESGSVDVIASDNRRSFVVHVVDRLRLLAVSGASSNIAARDELFFFHTALTAGGGESDGQSAVIVDRTTPNQLDTDTLERYPLVMLANVASLSEDQLAAVERYVDRGGNLLITLGDHVDLPSYNQWFGSQRMHGGLLPGRLSEPQTDTPDAPDAPDAPETFVAMIDQTHPILAGFGEGALGSLTDVRVTRCVRVAPDQGQVLMRLAGGTPLLVEKSFGQGRVMLLTTSIDRDWTNFPLQPTFVPWSLRLVGYLAQPGGGSGGDSGGGFVRTGASVVLPEALTGSNAMAVTLPDDTVGYAQPGTDAGGAMRFDQTSQAGVYTVRSGETAWLFAANPPAEESRTQYLDAVGLKAIAAPGISVALVTANDDLAGAASLAQPGRGLWDTLLILALIVGLVEPWIANRLSRRGAVRVTDALGRRDVLPATPDRERAA